MVPLNACKTIFFCAVLVTVVFGSVSPQRIDGFSVDRILDGGGRDVKTDVGKKRQLRLTASSHPKDQDAHFQDELRAAMNSHWEILQNIRYHTLISKMKVAQLDKKVKNLAQQIESKESDKRKTSSKPPCDKDLQEPEENGIQNGGEKKEVANLLTSLKELSQFYESFNYTTGIFDQPIGIDNVYEKLLQLLEKMKAFVATTDSKDPGKRQTRKLTNELTSVQLTTAAATKVTTTARPKTKAPSTSTSGDLGDDDLRSHNVTASPGTTVLLKCQVSDYPTAGTVVWTKSNPYGGFEILTAAHYIYSSDFRYSVGYEAESKAWTLTIKDVSSKDEGLYRCELNSISKNFYLIVRDDIQPTIDVTHTKNISAERGTTARLNCRVLNLGQYAVSWRGTDHYDNSVLLTYGFTSYSSNRRISIANKEESSDWVLTIDDVSKADEGVYNCEVNSIPARSQDVFLSVYEPDVKQSSADSGVLNVTLHGGSSHTFNCTVLPLRNSKIFWVREKDKRVFTSDKKTESHFQRIFAHQNSEFTSFLTVLDARKSDEGEYKCYRDSNPSPTPVISEYIQTVYLSIDMRPFIATGNSSNLSLAEGRTALLHCQVTNLGNYTVAWVKLNPNSGPYILTVGLVTVIYDPRYSVALEPSTNDWVLTISNVTDSDEGVYQCQISTHPVVSHSVTLDVIESQPVTAPAHDGIFAATEGDIALLPCRVQNLGDASVTWLRVSDQQVLTAGEYTLSPDLRFKAHTNDYETWFLQITNVGEDDEGEYLCQASTSPTTNLRLWLSVNDRKSSITVTSSAKEDDLSRPSTTEAPSCFSPFESVSHNLCILRVTEQKLSWVDASEYCKSQEADLAVDVDGAIQTFLEDKHGVEGENWTMWPFWIGGKEEIREDGTRHWKWRNNRAVNSTSWAYNQPRSYGKKRAPQGLCMTLDGYERYAAISLPCHYKRRFVCQRLH